MISGTGAGDPHGCAGGDGWESHQGWVTLLPLGAQFHGGMLLSHDGALSLDLPHSCSSSGTEQDSARPRHFHLPGMPLLHPQAPPGVSSPSIHLANEFAEFAALSECLQERHGVKSQSLFL